MNWQSRSSKQAGRSEANEVVLEETARAKMFAAPRGYFAQLSVLLAQPKACHLRAMDQFVSASTPKFSAEALAAFDLGELDPGLGAGYRIIGRSKRGRTGASRASEPGRADPGVLRCKGESDPTLKSSQVPPPGSSNTDRTSGLKKRRLNSGRS
jgi:hypothetical protein